MVDSFECDTGAYFQLKSVVTQVFIYEMLSPGILFSYFNMVVIIEEVLIRRRSRVFLLFQNAPLLFDLLLVFLFKLVTHIGIKFPFSNFCKE